MKRSPLVRKTPLKAKPGPTRRAWINRTTKGAKRKGRKPSEFARIYGSKARVTWVKMQPCAVCFTTPSENAHTETGGMGRKADFITIIPLCRAHHLRYDQHQVPFNTPILRQAAKDFAFAVQRRWQAYTLSRTTV